MKKLIIIGTGVTAKNVYDFIMHHDLHEVIGFAVNRDYFKEKSFCELPVFILEDLIDQSATDNYDFFIAILWSGANSDRRKAYEFCTSNELSLVNLIAPTSIIRGKIRGNNIWIGDYVVIQSGVTIYPDTFVRSCAVICHDTTIKSHTFISAKAVVGGECNIGEQAFIGINATIIDHITIGYQAIVGAGICLKENLPDNTIASYDSSNYHIKKYTATDIRHKLSPINQVATPPTNEKPT